jgi:endonuclease/exonuclease/phosphatase family metal-dependent hydrolase
MAKLFSKISFLLVVLIVFSMQDTTSLEQQNQIQPNQRQFKNEELSRNLKLNPDFGRVPLYFIPNQGQVDERALFYAKASKYTLWLTEEGLVFDSARRIKKESTKSMRLSPRGENNPENLKYERDVSRLLFLNTNTKPEVGPLNDTEHKVNYFIGKDESKWRTNIQTSRAVLYKELYPNIDLKVYGIEKQIEYDFVVKPGGEVSDIGFEYKDVEKTRIDKQGNLVVETEFGELEHTKPLCYQVVKGERVEIEAEFKKIKHNTYVFKVEGYNRNYELIIDPLIYSTYLGGSDYDEAAGIAVDSEGAAYVTGYTRSVDFPVKNPIQGRLATEGMDDAFIAKVSSSGEALIYSTYFGGTGEDRGNDIAIDQQDGVYVTGYTESIDFPTRNPIQANNKGGKDVFIAKLNSSGDTLIYSTYLGGSNKWDSGFGIAVDSEGAAYVTGYTRSVDFPVKNPIQGRLATEDLDDAFIAKVKPSGKALVYSTYLGGYYNEYGHEIAVDSKGAAYVIGRTNSTDFPTKKPIQENNAGHWDVIIAKVKPSGKALVYSTYLGGSDRDSGDSIAVDSEGAVYVTGSTNSTDFPLKKPIQGKIAGNRDVFIAKVNSSGSALVYSTYLGGFDEDGGSGIAIDSEGAAYVAGGTVSVDFPLKNPIQWNNAGRTDMFIAKVNSSGNALVYSTYLGGFDEDGSRCIAVDSEGAVYVAGKAWSTNFPTKNPIQSRIGGENDVFITKIVEGIRIASWNILNYPDMNEEPREEYFRSLIEILNPDILIVQEMASAAGVNQFLKEVLNPKKPKLYKAASFFDGPDTDNALFYKKAMFKVVSRQQIPTTFRDITEYKIKIKKGAAKGTMFKVYSVHFSEGAGAKKKRENEALTLRTYLDGLLPDELFLVCGSLNMLSSTEKAFKILTGNQANNNGRLMDPLNKKGKWQDKSKHRRIHTESTRKSKFGGGSGGGLDSRYDMVLISYGLVDNETLIYSDGSCSAFGNDGKHLNKAVNKPKNKAVSPEIAEALHQASDHLPVIIDLVPLEKK